MEPNGPTTGSSAAAPLLPSGDDFPTWRKVLNRAKEKARKDAEECDKYVKKFRCGEFSGDNKDGRGASVNQLYSFVMLLMSSLYSQSPAREVEARAGGDPQAFGPLSQMAPPEQLREAYAEALEQLVTMAAEQGEADDVNNVCLQDAILRGLAVCKVSFDPETQLPRLDALRRTEFYIDPAARYSLRQARYTIHTLSLPIERARAFFRAIGGPADIEPNFQAAGGQTQDDAAQQREDLDREQFRFSEIWSIEPNGKRVLYACEGRNDWLHQREWPVALPFNEFPFAVLAFNSQANELGDAFPEVSVADGLEQTHEHVLEFFRRHSLRSMKKLMLLDKSVYNEEDVQAFIDGKDMVPRLIEKGGKSWQDTIHIQDLNASNDTSYEIAEAFKRLRDEVLGQDELMRGGRSAKMTATEAEIREGQSTLRIGRRQKMLDAFLSRQTALMAQTARQLTPATVIAKIQGEEAALLWSMYSGRPEQFACEFSVGVGAGSSSERARREKMGRLNELLQAATQRNAALAGSGQPPAWDEDELLIEIAKAANLRRPERYRISAAPPAVNPSPGIPAAGGALPAGGQPAGAMPGPGPQMMPQGVNMPQGPQGAPMPQMMPQGVPA